jgi:hypothetical protein
MPFDRKISTMLPVSVTLPSDFLMADLCYRDGADDHILACKKDVAMVVRKA